MTKFQPRNPHWQTLVQTNFSGNPTINLLGVNLSIIAPGHIDLILENLHQQYFDDTGVVAAIMQTACHLAALSLSPQHSRPQLAEYKISYIAQRPDASANVNISGRVIRPGNTITVCRAEAKAPIPGGIASPVAAMTATYLMMQHPDS